MQQAVINAILNTIFVCIPEESSLVIMTLIFLKFDELLDILMWRKNLKWIMIAALPPAIMINIFRYIIVIPHNIMSLFAWISLIVSTLYIVIKNSDNINIKLILKTCFFMTVSFAMLIIFEEAYLPILLGLTHKPMSFFNANIFYNFLMAEPASVLYLCIVSFIIMRKNNKVQVNLFDIIMKNRLFTGSFLLLIIGVVLAISYIAKLVTNFNILSNLQFIQQVTIVVLITTIPVILMTFFLVFINYLLTNEKQKQIIYENIINSETLDDNDGYN